VLEGREILYNGKKLVMKEITKTRERRENKLKVNDGL